MRPDSPIPRTSAVGERRCPARLQRALRAAPRRAHRHVESRASQPPPPRCTTSRPPPHHAAQSRQPESHLLRAAPHRAHRHTMQPSRDGRRATSSALHHVAPIATSCSPAETAGEPPPPRCTISRPPPHHAAQSRQPDSHLLRAAPHRAHRHTMQPSRDDCDVKPVAIRLQLAAKNRRRCVTDRNPPTPPRRAPFGSFRTSNGTGLPD
jgi:hypothetical protein